MKDEIEKSYTIIEKIEWWTEHIFTIITKKITVGIRLLFIFKKKYKIPINWKYVFIIAFFSLNKFKKKFYQVIQANNYGDYYKFDDLKISFFPLKLINQKKYISDFIESFLTITFPFVYGLNTFHPYSFIESNYIDNKKMKIKPTDIVFDCGGYIGQFTIGASKMAYNGKIIVIEPFPENIELLLKNISQNNLKNVILISKAISDIEKNHDFIFFKEAPSSSGASYKAIKREKTKKGEKRIISCITIDQIFKDLNLQKVDFIKMDIEGMERYALIGAKEVISKFKPRLSICTYHLSDDRKVLPKIIKEIRKDYKIEMKIGKLYAS